MSKPMIRADRVEVVYDQKRWELLSGFRDKAIRIMEVLNRFHVSSTVFGSVARGDVSEKSDVDVYVSSPPSSFILEMALESADVPVNRRVVVQATPTHAVKGYIEVDHQRLVSFPLVKLRPIERDLYKFAGEASHTLLKNNVRVSGVDKRLVLIEPTTKGHVESAIIGYEDNVANLLGVSVDVVFNRVKTLLRRNEVGRTGVFIEREIHPDETFEMVIKKLADQKPAVRRRLRLFEK